MHSWGRAPTLVYTAPSGLGEEGGAVSMSHKGKPDKPPAFGSLSGLLEEMEKESFETKYKIDCGYQTQRRHKMIPTKFSMKSYHAEHRKHQERDNLLNDFELHQIERSAVCLKAHPVCRHLQAVLEECNPPREGYHCYHRPFLKPSHLA